MEALVWLVVQQLWLAGPLGALGRRDTAQVKPPHLQAVARQVMGRQGWHSQAMTAGMRRQAAGSRSYPTQR